MKAKVFWGVIEVRSVAKQNTEPRMCAKHFYLRRWTNNHITNCKKHKSGSNLIEIIWRDMQVWQNVHIWLLMLKKLLDLWNSSMALRFVNTNKLSTGALAHKYKTKERYYKFRLTDKYKFSAAFSTSANASSKWILFTRPFHEDSISSKKSLGMSG